MRLLLGCALAALLIGHSSAAPDTSPATLQPDVFSLSDYLSIYPDLLRAYGANPQQAADQWQQQGLPQEGRRAGVIFDPQYYLEKNPDVRAQSGARDFQAALHHFVTVGLAEGRRGSFEFDPKYYLATNPDVAQSVGPKNYAKAAEHFRVQGWPVEGRAGSAEFSIKTYIALYPDIAAAYGNNNYRQAMWHWLRRGKMLGRKGVPPPHSLGECETPQAKQGFTRIYIALRSDGREGSGTAQDPYDGSDEDRFDGSLRTRSERGDHDLIVCIGPGTFRTRGNADFVINLPHKTNLGFTVNRNWHVHGAGVDKTTLLLTYFQPHPFNLPSSSGAGVVFSTHDDGSSGIEVSDLTIDNNYAQLKQQARRSGTGDLNLEAIHLRSDNGGHHIHHVHMRGSAGEINEAFPISIGSVNGPVSQNNVIEFVTASDWGAGTCAAIVLFHATGEVRYNTIRDYEKGFGGWTLPHLGEQRAWFHDNFAIENQTEGFIVDSLINDGVVFEFNEIVHPHKWAIVIGGNGTYTNFQITDNVVELGRDASYSIVVQSHVTNAVIARNLLLLDPHAQTSRDVHMKGSGTHDVQVQNTVLKAIDCGQDGRCRPALTK